MICVMAERVAAEGEWTVQKYGAFGPQVSIPSQLIADENNGRGESRHTEIFRSRDGAFSVTIQNFVHVPESPEKRDTLLALMQEDLAAFRQVTFQRRHGRGYTIVARVGATKHFIQGFGRRSDSNGKALRRIIVSFPLNRREEFDPWLERIAASYQPFGGDRDK